MKRYLVLYFISLCFILSVYAQDNDTSGFYKKNAICIGLSASTNLDKDPLKITKFFQVVENRYTETDIIGLKYFDIYIPSLSLSFFPNKKWCHGIDIRYSKHEDDLKELDPQDIFGDYNFNHTSITYGLDYLLIHKDSNNNPSVYPFVGINSMFSFFNFYTDTWSHNMMDEEYFRKKDYNIFNFSLQPCFGIQLNSRRILAEVALNFNVFGFYNEKYETENTTKYYHIGEEPYSITSNKDGSNSSFISVGDYNDKALLFHSLSFKIAYKL